MFNHVNTVCPYGTENPLKAETESHNRVAGTIQTFAGAVPFPLSPLAPREQKAIVT